MSALDQLNGASAAINSANWLKLDKGDCAELQVLEIGAPYTKEWDEGKPSQHMRLDVHCFNAHRDGAPEVIDAGLAYDPQCGWLVELKDLATVLAKESGDADAILKQRIFVRRKDRKGAKGFYYGWLEISTLGPADAFGSPEPHVNERGEPLFAGVTVRRAPQNDGAPGTTGQAPLKPALPPARPAVAPAAAPAPVRPPVASAPAAPPVRPAAAPPPPPARPGPPAARPAPPPPPFNLAAVKAEIDKADAVGLVNLWRKHKDNAGAQRDELAEAYKAAAYYAGTDALATIVDSPSAQTAWALCVRLLGDFPVELDDWLKAPYSARCAELNLVDDIPF